MPERESDAEIKKAYDDALGPALCCLTYDEECRWLRKLLQGFISDFDGSNAR